MPISTAVVFGFMSVMFVKTLRLVNRSPTTDSLSFRNLPVPALLSLISADSISTAYQPAGRTSKSDEEGWSVGTECPPYRSEMSPMGYCSSLVVLGVGVVLIAASIAASKAA